MKKLMLYLTGEEYQKIREGAFQGNISMNQWVKDRLFQIKVPKTITLSKKEETKFVETGVPYEGAIDVPMETQAKEYEKVKKVIDKSYKKVVISNLCEHGLPKNLCKQCMFK